jgi:hypothetical protein
MKEWSGGFGQSFMLWMAEEEEQWVPRESDRVNQKTKYIFTKIIL